MTSKKHLIEALYYSGFEFAVKGNSIELLNGSSKSDKLVFLFDEDEDICDIRGVMNDDFLNNE